VQSDLAKFQERFGDRFPGTRLAVVQELLWPVYKHDFRVVERSTASLNPIEHAILGTVLAGVSDRDEVRAFVGVGQRYFNQLLEDLESEGPGASRGSLVLANDGVYPSEETRPAVDTCLRWTQTEHRYSFLRDALFDLPVDYCQNRFVLRLSRGELSPTWQLGPGVGSTIDAVDVGQIEEGCRQATAAENEIVASELDQVGSLAWVPLIAGCYQSEDRRAGRVVLFNPADDDRPLGDLSERFERLLVDEGCPPLYYPGDMLDTSTALWRALAASVVSATHESNLLDVTSRLQGATESLNKLHSESEPVFRPLEALALRLAEIDGDLAAGDVEQARALYQSAARCYLDVVCFDYGARAPEAGGLRRAVESLEQNSEISESQRTYMDELMEHVLDVPVNAEWLATAAANLKRSMPHLPSFARLQALDVDKIREREHLGQECERLTAEVRELRSLIEQAPRVVHLQTAEHAAWLARALSEASEAIIIVSPWLKVRVVRPLLGSMKHALERGCEVWIGHGMPTSAFHQDRSDEEAVQLIDGLQRYGRLIRVDNLGTHEKVLVCDDEFFVTTSYNWLSYDGKDRREHGVVQFGSQVSALKAQYLGVMQERAGRYAV
jgi:hypothetical protein